jgi:hypothetical protein
MITHLAIKHAGNRWMRACLAFVLAAMTVLAGQVSEAAVETPEPGGIFLRVQTPAYQLTAHGVQIDGDSRFVPNDQPGAPALPVWRTVVELPASGGWDLSYDSPRAQVLAQPVQQAATPAPDLAPLDRVHGVDPAELPSAVPMVNRPDPAIYGVNAFYPAAPVLAGQVQWRQGKRLLPVQVFPFQYNPVTRQVRYHPDLVVSVHLTPGEGESVAGAPSTPAYAPASAGSLRIRIDQRGLYRLSYDDLLAAGVPLASTDVSSFAITYLGQPVAVEVTGDGDEQFEPGELVVFYARPYEGRFQADNVYWFSYGGPPGLRMATRAVTPTGSEPLITTITQTLRIEPQMVYESIFPLPSIADHWFDSRMSPDTAAGMPTVHRSYVLALDDPIFSGTARLRAGLHGGAARAGFNPDQSVAIYLNDHLVTTHQWQGMTYTTVDEAVPAAWLAAAPAVARLTAAVDQLPGIGFYSIAPDWLAVSYPALADAEGDAIYIEGTAAGANQVQVSGWSTPEVQVYELRDPDRPVRILTTAAEPAGGGYSVSFWDAALPGPTYALSTRAALRTPLAIEPDTPSSWGTPDHAADYIAIVHPSLWSAIDPLLAHRAAEGLRIAKVDVQDIYDEWSYGRRDPEAIRSFLSYAYHHWNNATQSLVPSPQSLVPPPQYVLLVGTGHYDFTGVSGTTFPNLIPPFLIHIDPWLGETAADNRYVSVDGPNDYLPEMAIGRIPARTPADVTAVVDKIIAYETAPAGPWQERVVFVADNHLDPAGNFHAYSDAVRLNWLPAGYDDRTIYYNRDYFSGAAMRTAIKAAFDADALVLQWFGHGSRFRWGSVSMFNTLDLAPLAANDTWPFTVSYTCWTGYFINLLTTGNGRSLAETLLVTPQRGSVADLSPSGLHVGGALLIFNQGLTQAQFQQRIVRVGLAVDEAKVYYYSHAGSFHDVLDTMVYFGDPALKLRLPEPQLAGSTLEASRAWAPPGLPITVTATLTSTAAVSATAQLILTLPAGLAEPSNLSATSSTATYDPLRREITWSGAVTTGVAEAVSFRSALLPDVAACSQAVVAGQARDGLAALTPLAVALQAVTPDVDCDGDVDIVDIQLVTAHWGAAQGDPAYHPRYDLDGDDAIDALDVVLVASSWQ